MVFLLSQVVRDAASSVVCVYRFSSRKRRSTWLEGAGATSTARAAFRGLRD
jgi:hypothetical protein